MSQSPGCTEPRSAWQNDPEVNDRGQIIFSVECRRLVHNHRRGTSYGSQLWDSEITSQVIPVQRVKDCIYEFSRDFQDPIIRYFLQMHGYSNSSPYMPYAYGKSKSPRSGLKSIVTSGRIRLRWLHSMPSFHAKIEFLRMTSGWGLSHFEISPNI